MSEEEQINCKWLNKSFGKNCWICDGMLKPTNIEICKECEDKLETKKGGNNICQKK